MGVKILKSYSSDKLQPKFLVLNFLHNGPHKTAFGIFEILSFQFFNDFFFKNFKFTIVHVSYGEIKNLNYLENERL